MSNWEEKAIKDICISITSGGTPSRSISEYYSNGNICWVKTKELNNFYIYDTEEKITENAIRKSSAKLLPKNTVLLAMYGATVGETAILGKEMACNQACCAMIVNENIVDYRFLFYLLILHKTKIKNLATGAAQQNISVKMVKELTFRIPEKELQIKIANILESLDQKIILNTQTNQTLEQIAQAIFKHWFIDFTPVHAKANALARGETIEQAELAAMACLSGKTVEKITALKTQDPTTYHQLQQTAAAFPSEFVETEMGQVPRGWEVKQVKDMGKIICGKTPSKKKEEFYGNDIPFIKIPDMHNNTFIIKTTDNLSLLGANNQKNKFIEKGSICISCIATVGLVSITSERSQTNQQINSIVPNSEIFTEYLYLYFSQDTMNKKLKDLASGGSATLNLNTTAFSNITLLIPNNNLIEFFHKKVQPLFDKILSNKKESISLSDARDELLPKLLRGEIEL
ncbi:hypothetical protein JP28_10990 [Gallibacterium anatis]|uniref:restriction endonuclease subunit S n=1 Tax=Gallibacterium anatis TaxID=750 RepID=UPI00053103FF|nr:restriction endonuclease subunit S [Gallibacterium anatis]KGQ42748.1 hypothetical protein JP28_10990 [Gallibacterium anatis]